MKNLNYKIGLFITMLLSNLGTIAQDLPSEFDDVINDNPTDASIEQPAWMFLVLFVILLLGFNKIQKSFKIYFFKQSS